MSKEKNKKRKADSIESAPSSEYKQLLSNTIRRGSISLFKDQTIATKVSALRVGVWNVQDFGSGPSGMWAVDFDSEWDEKQIDIAKSWLQEHFSSIMIAVSTDDTMIDASAANVQSPDLKLQLDQHSADADLRKALRKKKPLGLDSALIPLVRRIIFEQRVMGIEQYCAATQAEVFIVLEAQTNGRREGTQAPKDPFAADINAYDDWLLALKSKPGHRYSYDGWGHLIQLLYEDNNEVFPDKKSSKQKALWQKAFKNETGYLTEEQEALYSKDWDDNRINKYKVYCAKEPNSTCFPTPDFVKWVDEQLWNAAEEVSDFFDQAEEDWRVKNAERLDMLNKINKDFPLNKAQGRTKLTPKQKADNVAQLQNRLCAKNLKRYPMLESECNELEQKMNELKEKKSWMERVKKCRTNCDNCEYAFEPSSSVGSSLPAILSILQKQARSSGATWHQGASHTDGETILVRIASKSDPLNITTQSLSSSERPTWKFVYKNVTFLAVHAPAPARIPNSKDWFEKLNEVVVGCTAPTIVLGDFNTSKKAINKHTFLKSWYGKYSPVLEHHIDDRTSVRAWTNKNHDFKSEAYDKILFNTTHSVGVDLELDEVSRPEWQSAAAVRRYSDHMFRCADITYQLHNNVLNDVTKIDIPPVATDDTMTDILSVVSGDTKNDETITHSPKKKQKIELGS